MAKDKNKTGFFKEFKEFISRGNVLDMAVGIIIGGAFTAIVSAIVSGILTPLLQAIPGMNEETFSALQLVLNKTAVANGADPVILDFGIVISAIVTFLLTAIILFLIVYTVNHTRAKAEELKAKREAKDAEPVVEEPAPAPAPTTEELLTQIRDLLAAQNEKKKESVAAKAEAPKEDTTKEKAPKEENSQEAAPQEETSKED